MKTWPSALLKEINKCLVCEKVHKEGKRRPENARGHRCWQWFHGSAVAQEVLGAWIVSRTTVGDRAVSEDQPGSSPGCPTFGGRTSIIAPGPHPAKISAFPGVRIGSFYKCGSKVWVPGAHLSPACHKPGHHKPSEDFHLLGNYQFRKLIILNHPI